ncbi:MAG: von Willebrand factor type A domain-containing protein, partial [Planctomycetales bacterium]|nr:von Willebrand factor type A domain-containing protein [Planctomycetales bacterium]
PDDEVWKLPRGQRDSLLAVFDGRVMPPAEDRAVHGPADPRTPRSPGWNALRQLSAIAAVLCVMGVVIALLLPSVHSARYSARRGQVTSVDDFESASASEEATNDLAAGSNLSFELSEKATPQKALRELHRNFESDMTLSSDSQRIAGDRFQRAKSDQLYDEEYLDAGRKWNRGFQEQAPTQDAAKSEVGSGDVSGREHWSDNGGQPVDAGQGVQEFDEDTPQFYGEELARPGLAVTSPASPTAETRGEGISVERYGQRSDEGRSGGFAGKPESLSLDLKDGVVREPAGEPSAGTEQKALGGIVLGVPVEIPRVPSSSELPSDTSTTIPYQVIAEGAELPDSSVTYSIDSIDADGEMLAEDPFGVDPAPRGGRSSNRRETELGQSRGNGDGSGAFGNDAFRYRWSFTDESHSNGPREAGELGSPTVGGYVLSDGLVVDYTANGLVPQNSPEAGVQERVLEKGSIVSSFSTSGQLFGDTTHEKNKERMFGRSVGHSLLPELGTVVATAGLDELQTQNDPFSTFSLHVSDVSFKLARAALAEGRWPEADKVRIEEFVNAFDYGDPLPSRDEKVACQLEQAIHPFLQQRNVMRISLRTAAAGRAQSTPLRLTLLLDNSGSMERADRRQTVRRAFALLTDQLQETDQVTLIAFARQPRLLADRVSGTAARQLVELIQDLPSEGGTNIEAALTLALEKAREQMVDGAQNRIILLTDGAVNLGDAEPESLSRMVTTIRDAGIAFDAAGISADGLNDEVLEALTRQGDGRYYLLDSADTVDESFARQVAGALRPSAKNVKVQIEFNPERVDHYKLLGFEKHRLNQEDFRNDSVDAAEMTAAEAGVAVYQYEAKPDMEGDIGAVSVRFRDLSTGQMVERRWPIPYQPDAPRWESAAPSLQIATTAAMLAARLRGEPLGATVDLQSLSNVVAALPEAERRDNRVLMLGQMIQQARQLGAQQ